MECGIKPCDNQAQDQWSGLYLAMARALVEKYNLPGKIAVREGVRRYAAELARSRRQELIGGGNKTNLQTVFAGGFGFPCGNRTRAELIECSEQQFFINIAACPYAEYWAEQDALELGRMFCEEYYPVLTRVAASEKAQINLGNTLTSGRDEYCRLSIYLRPANLPPEQRAQCFPYFDVSGAKPLAPPDYQPDLELQKQLLYAAFIQTAREQLGQEGAAVIAAAVQDFMPALEQAEVRL